MMKVSMIAHGITLVLLATALPAAHAAGTWTEVRNDAMGGTGVAPSGYTAAALANPAMMPATMLALSSRMSGRRSAIQII